MCSELSNLFKKIYLKNNSKTFIMIFFTFVFLKYRKRKRKKRIKSKFKINHTRANFCEAFSILFEKRHWENYL